MVLHIRVGRLAHKYNMEELCNLAVDKFMRDGDIYWAHEEFADALLEAYSANHDVRFHKAALHIACKHYQELSNEPDRYQPFWDAVEQDGRTARSILLALAPLLTPMLETGKADMRYQCPCCSLTFRADMSELDSFTHKCRGSGEYTMTKEAWEDCLLVN